MVEPMLQIQNSEDLLADQIEFFPNWIDESTAWHLFDLLKLKLTWKQGQLQMYGKKVNTPRLECFLSDPNVHYTYSGQLLARYDWPDFLSPIHQKLKKLYSKPFNACLANYYRNGHDKVGWHADDEANLGKHPLIASLSFGASRTFQIKHNTKSNQQQWLLTHGSLLIMKNNFQTDWKHQIPLEKKVLGSRINLTFRTIK